MSVSIIVEAEVITNLNEVFDICTTPPKIFFNLFSITAKNVRIFFLVPIQR